MTIQLHGVYVHNAGDVLMMHAAIGRLSGKHRLDISNDRTQTPYAVIDLCGYWLGDPWMIRPPNAPSKAEQMAHAVKQWKAAGTKIILMPQTFGPFTDPFLCEQARIIIENADLVCARDQRSLEYIQALCGKQPNMRLFPDYTAEVRGSPSDKFVVPAHAVAIIPNKRMIDRAAPAIAEKYIGVLARCMDQLAERKLNFFLLPHEMRDHVLAQEISSRCGGVPPRICIETDAQVIRGIINQCTAVIGSRYHGILSALYQDVPAIGTSWNHKFDELFAEYGCSNMLLGHDDTDVHLDAAIERIVNTDARATLISGIRQKNTQRQAQVSRLWEDVFAVIAPSTLRT